MKHYAHVTDTGELLGWYNYDVHDSIPEPNIEFTEQEWQEAISINANCIVDGKLVKIDIRTKEQKAKDARFVRDSLLKKLDSLVYNPLRWQEFSSEQKESLAKYRLDLLNVPEQFGFPEEIEWPIKPVV